MTAKEAWQIVREFDNGIRNPSEDEFFLFTEAMDFLITTEKRPQDMMYLGGVYYEKRHFDLALNYYEMAASYDYDEAYECLGYIWYYGRTGDRDFEKAFTYFSKLKEKGNLVAAYKVADMYKNGYYVEKDPETYKKIIEELYPKVLKCRNVFDPVPEVFTRLAHIRREEGLWNEAADLYMKAKEWLAKRIHFNAFFGNLNIMKWLIEDLYEVIKFNEKYFDFYDLYYLLKTPHTITFEYDGEIQHLYSEQDGDECNICYNGKWFRSRDDFFQQAEVKDTNIKLTAVEDELYRFSLVE